MTLHRSKWINFIFVAASCFQGIDAHATQIHARPSREEQAAPPMLATTSNSITDQHTGELQPAIGKSPELLRNVQRFADGLKSQGYQAEIDLTATTGPKIYTGLEGVKIAIAFSSCDHLDCQYAEIISTWTGVEDDVATKMIQDYGLDENFANVFYEKSAKNMAVFHYVVLGKEGITMQNLLDNLEYFAREFQKVGSIAVKK